MKFYTGIGSQQSGVAGERTRGSYLLSAKLSAADRSRMGESFPSAVDPLLTQSRSKRVLIPTHCSYRWPVQINGSYNKNKDQKFGEETGGSI